MSNQEVGSTDMPSHGTEYVLSNEEASTSVEKPRRKPRKKVSKNKLVQRRKQRGKYNPKVVKPVPQESNISSIGLLDVDLAECIHSDEEERAGFLRDRNLLMLESEPQHADDCELHIEPVTPNLQSEARSSSGSAVLIPLPLHNVPDLTDLFSTPAQSQSPTETSHCTSPSFSANAASGLREVSSQSTSEPSSSIQAGIVQSPEMVTTHAAACESVPVSSSYSPPLTVTSALLSKLRECLPSAWIPICGRIGVHLLLVSDEAPRALQREIIIFYDGKESMFAHCKTPPSEKFILDSVKCPNVVLDETNVDKFALRAMSVIMKVMEFDVCLGADHLESRDIWENVPNSYIDRNPYREQSFIETCRSVQCTLLIKGGKGKRCEACTAILRSLKSRLKSLHSVSYKSCTPNIYLSRDQALQKLQSQHDVIKKKDSQIRYLTTRVQASLQNDGIDLEDDLSGDLASIIRDSAMSPVQKLFLEEQVKCSSKADPRAHRWHPAMIRLALHIKMVSSSAYEALRDSKAIRLPSSRTLHDYSHAFEPQSGVSPGILKMVKDKVSQFDEPHKKYVALLVDEMHVSSNLVYRQSDNTLIGYVHLNEVDKEIAKLEQHVNSNESDLKVPLANKMLAFMVKGLTSDIKHVVASYPCNQLNKDMLYSRTWHVISLLERAGVKVLCIVSDGCSVNRALIDMHKPITKTVSGAVFDTINFCSPERRPLYFISDVAHLIKTIRNCFYNSGEGGKKTRCLQVNHEKIVWKTIIRLYLTYSQYNFRKSYKLNQQNVFPNSYSCMKVRLAAQVLSNTVATDIEQQNWPGTTETVKFIRNVNDFFDCLNGAHSIQHIKQRKPNLAPYTDENDSRFEQLQAFLDYLEDWRKQSESLPLPPNQREKTMLSHQTIKGIEIAIKGFAGATKFLLKEGAKFIMARAFSQDPLEQHFSLQRSKGGGSSNPSVSQFENQRDSISMQRELGVQKRKGNTVASGEGMDISSDPLPKRRKPRHPRKET